MHVTLLHNPTAGEEEHRADALRSMLETAGHDVVYHSVKEAGWETAIRQESELVVAAGGDGTVGKVFKELRETGTTATVLPLGSANNVARTLGIAEERIDQLVKSWSDGTRRPFDIGHASASWGTAGFVESIGGGIFAEVLTRADDAPDGEEKLEHGLTLLREVIDDARSLPWKLTADGSDLSGEFLAVEAMNIRETGPNVLLAGRADPGDGLLDVVCVQATDRDGLRAYVDERLLGSDPAPPPFSIHRASRLVFEPPAGCPLHADDQLWPRSPDCHDVPTVVVTVRGAPLQLLLPQ